MKAWVSHTAGGPDTLVLEDRPMPVAGAGELRVRVQAVGINYPDGLLIRDLYQVKPPRPLVPGSEFCGVVDAAGPGVTRFQAGNVVIGRCGWGALAEFVVIAHERCVTIPPELERAEAAAFMFAYATAYHALVDAARLRDGQTLLVLGAAGGVGSAAVELGRALGANVLAAASTDAKLAFACSRGAARGVVYDAALGAGDGQKALAATFKQLAPTGVDVVFDPVGGAYTEAAFRSLARHGRHLVVGFTAGIPRLPTNLALLKSAQLIGVDWRMFVQEEPDANAQNVASLLAMWRAGRIRPQVSELFPFLAAPDAIARLESRGAMGKVAVAVAP
jgi:NADPH2:quinone reductase